MLDGIARKIGLVIAIIAVVGWLLIAVGFGFERSYFAGTRIPPVNEYDLGYLAQWLISVEGLPLIGLAIVHAIVSNAKATKILGMITTFFSLSLFVALGALLYVVSVRMYSRSEGYPTGRTKFWHATNLQFTGTILTGLTWILLMVGIWPFYVVVPKASRYSESEPKKEPANLYE